MAESKKKRDATSVITLVISRLIVRKERNALKRKGTFYVSVCFESNHIEMPNNTWWLDSGMTTHVSYVMQRFLSIQPISETEKFLFMGNRTKARIEGIRTYTLILDTEHFLNLEKCLYIPECARIIISIGKLYDLGFNIKFGSGVSSLFKQE